MSVSTTIKNQLKGKIQSCSSVQVVYGHEELNPSGFPAVFVRPADMEGEFSSTAENSRVYGFRILILFPMGQDFVPPNNENRVEYAEQVISTVIDEIINAIDNDFELDGSPVLFTNAADVEWGEYEAENGICKAALMTIRVYTEHNVFTNQES